MLKAYSYCEYDFENIQIHDDKYFHREKSIAKRFAEENIVKNNRGLINKKCPICSNKNWDYFYIKWGIPYLRCRKCYSIFAECDEEVVNQYINIPELIELRTSNEYQDNASLTRADEWKEFLQWISIRAYRYCNSNRNFKIVDIGNRHYGFMKLIQESSLCGKYFLQNSILQVNCDKSVTDADLVFYLNAMQKEMNPKKRLIEIKRTLKEKGLLVIQTRAGSGFDILTLRERNEKIFPYEHIMLPTVEGLLLLLNNIGFKVLEITTPGVLDIQYAKKNAKKIDDTEVFAKYLMEHGDNTTLQEFQRFLQKNGLSSFVQVIAQKQSDLEGIE